MTTDLDVEIRASLERRRGDWQKIADRAAVSHSWISQFVRGKIPNPGYATLKRLQACLGRSKSDDSSDAPERANG
jgi:transcriptional regulator with XRE-family HTH domain